MNARQFYENNKDISWQMPAAPKEFESNYELVDWLLKSNFGWLKLDLEIDLARWKDEAELCRQYLVPHRESNNSGWNSCCIHGIDVDKTGAWTLYGYDYEVQVPYNWTNISHKTPCIKDFWKNTFPSDKYRRIRFMELTPQSAITPHSDMPGRLPGEDNFNALEFGIPINIAVIHPRDCYMVVEGYGIVPFKEGEAYIVNIKNYHSVINFSNESRIHVIGHSFGYGSKKKDFVDLVARSYRKTIDDSRI